MVETGSNASSTAALMANVKAGTGTIVAGQTSVNVAHGLAGAPTGYSATPITNSLGVDIYVSAVDATNLTVSMDFAQGADVAFSWTAVR